MVLYQIAKWFTCLDMKSLIRHLSCKNSKSTTGWEWRTMD